MEQRFIDSQTYSEILSDAPRSLTCIQAELLFLRDTYLFHYREDGREVYKSLSSDSLRLAFNNQPLDSGWMPPNILRHGSNRRGEWSVLFIPQAKHAITLGERQLCIPLPSLVFVGLGKNYWLWATRSPHFDPHAPAFHAPLTNVDADNFGLICWGSNRPPSANPHHISEAWKLFIDSPFSNHYFNYKSRQFPKDITERLLQLHDRSLPCYPLSDLIPIAKPYGTLQKLTEVVLADR